MAKTPKSREDETPEISALPEAADAVTEVVVVLDEPEPDPAAEPDTGDTAETDMAAEKPEPAEPVALTPMPRRAGGFLALLLGGAAAAVIGFTAARYVVPDGWPFPGVAPEVDPLALALETQGERLAGLENTQSMQGAAIAAFQADTALEVMRGELSGEFGQVQAQIQAIGERIDALEARLTAVEKLPEGDGAEAAAAAAAAYERELAEMRAMLDAELARIGSVQADAQVLETNAAQAALAAAGRAALTRVLAALDTGRPFDDALFDLTEATGGEAPATLAGMAETGVPTLAGLQQDFPDAARAALTASIQAAVQDGSMDRVTAFLRTQLGTRSLEPREGGDPDAILSRAEAALGNGRIDDSLRELEAMPDAAKPALANWIATATARRDAVQAGAMLAREMNRN